MTTDLLNTMDWSAKALAGEWKTLSGGQIDVIEPATGQVLAKVALANAQDVQDSAMLAKQAQKTWAAMPYGERSRIFRKAADLLEANRQAFATWIVRETGGKARRQPFRRGVAHGIGQPRQRCGGAARQPATQQQSERHHRDPGPRQQLQDLRAHWPDHEQRADFGDQPRGRPVRIRRLQRAQVVMAPPGAGVFFQN